MSVGWKKQGFEWKYLDKQTQCYDRSERFKHGVGEVATVEKEKGVKATESRSIYPGACTGRSAENKIGIL